MKKKPNRSLLPDKIYCHYHGLLVRSCEHRDAGLLDRNLKRITVDNVIDGLLDIHNQFSYPDSNFYKGDREQYRKFKNECTRLLVHFGVELPQV
jgi:hypothetical protein